MAQQSAHFAMILGAIHIPDDDLLGILELVSKFIPIWLHLFAVASPATV